MNIEGGHVFYSQAILFYMRDLPLVTASRKCNEVLLIFEHLKRYYIFRCVKTYSKKIKCLSIFQVGEKIMYLKTPLVQCIVQDHVEVMADEDIYHHSLIKFRAAL